MNNYLSIERWRRRRQNFYEDNAVSYALQGQNTPSVPKIFDRWMKSAGLWEGATHRSVRLWARISAYILLLSCLAQTATLVSIVDSQGLIDCISVLSFCLMGLVKLTSMRTFINRWHALVTHTNSLEEQQSQKARQSLNSAENVEYETDGEWEDLDERSRYAEKTRKLSVGLSIIYWGTGLVFVVAPFVEYPLVYLSTEHTNQSNLEDHTRLHILPIWAPFDDSVVGYSLTILFEIVSAFYCVSVHVAFDITSIGFMIVVSGQLIMLRRRLERIGGKGRSLMSSVPRDRRAHYRIIQCHQHHLVLMDMCRVLDSLTKPTMGIYVNLVTLALCATAVQMMNPMSKLRQLTLVAYISANLTQLFFFCWYGDAVLSQSNLSAAGAGAHGAAWWCLGVRVRRELQLLGGGSARPRRLRAGWFHVLDRTTFLAVLQTAYSFYAVISKHQLQ